jgi:hypothetical protein
VQILKFNLVNVILKTDFKSILLKIGCSKVKKEQIFPFYRLLLFMLETNKTRGSGEPVSLT